MTAQPPLRPSQPLYDLLSGTYEEHFDVPHRRLYDQLAWERVEALLGDTARTAERPLVVVDAGCGVGRWARRFVGLGCSVVGIEQSPGMLAQLRHRPPGPGFTLVDRPMQEVARADLFGPDGAGADAVVAMGSLQYTPDPEATVAALASWLREGGFLAVLVDSLVCLALELVGSGRDDEALERLSTGRGVWRVEDREADLHLLDRDRLVAAFHRAGLVDVRAAGLLVSAGALGREGLLSRATQDYDGLIALERRLADLPVLADAGKQLLVTGRRPPR